MGRLVIVLLVLWLVLVIIGFVINALLWLAIAGIVLFVTTSIWNDCPSAAPAPRRPRRPGWLSKLIMTLVRAPICGND